MSMIIVSFWLIFSAIFTLMDIGYIYMYFDEFGNVPLTTPMALKDKYKTNLPYAIAIYIMFAFFNPIGFLIRISYFIYRKIRSKRYMKCGECGTDLQWMVRFGADATASGRSEALFNCPHCGSSWNAIYDEDGGKIEKMERHST